MSNELTKEYLIKLREKVLQIDKAGEIEKILEHKTLYQRFKDTALRKPDSIALMYFGNKITYRQMLTLIDNAAKGFSEIGIKYNDIVTCSLLSTPYGIVSFYALDKIGATMHMVNGASNANELKRELSNIKSKYFVANDLFYGKEIRSSLKETGIEKTITISLVDSIPLGFNGNKLKYQFIEKLKGVSKKEFDGEKLISFEKLLDLGRQSKKEEIECEFVPNKLATIAYTSGSTGNAKACMATWEGLDSMIQVMGMTEIGRFEEDDIMFTTFPLWIYYCLLNMVHEPLCLGVGLALDPLFDPKDIAKRNKEYKFNHWLTVPPYIKTMIEMNKPMDCSKWKLVVTGGAELPDEVKISADKYIKKNGGVAHVEQGYGANEMLGSFSYGYHNNPTVGTIGVPCIGNMIKIVNTETGKELGINETGVAYLYSPAMMSGYYGDEESSNHNLVKYGEATWYNTEDLLHRNERGELFLDGRIRRIALTLDAKGNPTKIIPERTKKSIVDMEEVLECEVITVPDELRVNKAIAYVVLNEHIDENELRKKIINHCSKSVPEYMVPREIYFINKIPLLASKKTDFKALEELYSSSKEQKEGKTKVKRLFKKK